MKKTFKYRMSGNSTAFANAEMWLDLCHNLYNTALEQRISIYHQNKGKISCYEQMRQLPELKLAFPEYQAVSAQTLQEVLERLDKAFINFFREYRNNSNKVGFPRFKSRWRYDSFTLKQYGWKLVGKYLTISKVGVFKLRLSRPIQGNIKTITIRRGKTDKWYACFSCDNVLEKKLPKLDNSVGLDVGIKSFLVDSDGIAISNPQFNRQSRTLLRRRQRIITRRKKGSMRKKDACALVSRTYEKIGNQRNDFLHKLANLYIKNYGTLIFENLNIKGMIKNRHLSKSISDASWRMFYELCVYKAEEAGRQVVRISRTEPTSKTCSECGAINHELKLSDRQWICKECGVLHDRDHNAAENIKRVGQTQQVLTCENTQSVACESSRFSKRGVSMVHQPKTKQSKIKEAKNEN